MEFLGRSVATRPDRRRWFSVEDLARRDLPAATLSGGILTIAASQAANNVALVSINAANNNAVRVSLNGVVTEFAAGSVQRIAYLGGQNGGDAFINATAIGSTDFFTGDNNLAIG